MNAMAVVMHNTNWYYKTDSILYLQKANAQM